MGLKEYALGISVPAFISVCVFAVASWIALNGVWVEVPLMVNALPEGWNLPSYLVVVIQVANVGPLTFAIAKRLAPNEVQEWRVIYAIVGTGSVSCLLLVFFHDRTTHIGATEHSTSLLVLTLLLALVDCTSSVVFLPYMAQYAAQYLTAFYVGEGLSGLLPSVLGLIQGAGSDPECVNVTDPTSNGTEFVVVPRYDPPRFSVGAFFGILFLLLCCSAVAFTLLHFHPKFRRLHRLGVGASVAESPTSGRYGSLDDEGEDSGQLIVISYRHDSRIADESSRLVETEVSTSPATRNAADFRLLSYDAMVPLITVGWINALTNGVLPSIQSYSCLPYGNMTYNMAVRLSVLANPVACFLGLFFQVRSTFVCVAMATVGTVLAGYQIALAALSPYPPLHDHVIGSVLAVSTFVFLTAMFSFTKMSVAAILSGRGGARALLWCGGVTQIGSCVGAIATFLLINVAKIFKSKNACA